MKQRTIRKSIRCSGIGLHSGRKVTLCLRPATEDAGVLFISKGSFGEKMLRPSPDAVVCTGLATTLGRGECKISTVEHLLSAIQGLGIDNITIEVEGGEIPIMDGSAASFVLLLRSAGIRQQKAPQKVLSIKKSVSFERDGKWIKADPARGFHLDYTISFNHPLVGTQHGRMTLDDESFSKHIARARTFGFLKDVEYLKKNGLALGGSLENAVVLDEYGVVNPDGLRFEDEFVRHKMLDFVGDMALLEHPLRGAFTVFCSGHALNNEFLRFIDANREDYLKLETLEEIADSSVTSPVFTDARGSVPAWV